MIKQTFRRENTSTTSGISPISSTTISPTVSSIISPFFQWVGGKRKIVDKLLERIPSGLNNYYEPFLGGGALFFQVKDKFNKCFLSDINLELVTSYNAVKKDPAKIIELCKLYRLKHTREYYYRVRDNKIRDNNINSNDPIEITARFLYLNRYSFRGIYRVNKDDQVKVTYSTKNYFMANNFPAILNKCSNLLQDAIIYASDFSFIEPQANDFVYFDPPYHKSGESFYTRLPFGENDQVRLKNCAKELSNKGVKLMISNSDTSFIRDLYKDFNISTITAKYSMPNGISSNAKRIANELLITNY
jgi:DNA adenine methylase